MARVMTFTGNEPLISEAIAYLERRGIMRQDIVALSVDAPLGEPQKLTVTLLVNAELSPTPAIEDPCAGECPDPAAHAEGAHDV